MHQEQAADDAVRVTVTPSQASYFAGERFSVTVTITNTRAPQPTLQAHSASHAQGHIHKRGAHSVSYVPMARPPTSPGIRTALPAAPAKPTPTGTVIARRGIVGKPRPMKGIDDSGEQSEQTRKRLLLNRSQSISVSAHDLRPDSQDEIKGKSPMRSLRVLETPLASPTSPRVSSPLARSAPVPPNHPHARKNSLFDGQAQIQPMSPSSSASITPSASTSTFSLSLESIAEGASSPMPPETPATSSPVVERGYLPPQITFSTSAPSALHASARDVTHQKTQHGLGRGPPPIVVQPPQPRAASSKFAVPNTELILYSYAQLSGTLSISPLEDVSLTPEQQHTLQTVRRNLLSTKAVGGGSLDISSHSPQSLAPGTQLSTSRRIPHSRSTSLSGSLLSLISPSSRGPLSPTSTLSPQTSRPMHHRRSSSVFSTFFQSGALSSSSVNDLAIGPSPLEEDEVDADVPLPTFDVQPTMLAVDLSLGPGESRDYIYELTLPSNLPPSYRGRTLRLSYEFILGICRASGSSTASSNSHSRVMKVPIRLYNNVVVGVPPTPYDLLWPFSSRKPQRMPGGPVEATVREVRESLKKFQVLRAPGSRAGLDGSLETVRTYARNLLSSANGPTVDNRGLKWLGPDANGSLELPGEDILSERELSCREAVEMLTRNPKKLSYDVNKDGTKVAVLTFTKSAYRLGESVLAVVELNGRGSRTRVLKLSALLEAHESLPSSIAPPPPSSSRQMRRIHAEHHSSFVTSTLRTTFSLDIPPDASPAFQVDVPTKHSTPGGLEWKVRLYLLVAVASPTAREGVDNVRLKNLVVDGPRGEWGTSWTAARTIAPLERSAAALSSDDTTLHVPRASQSWTSFLTSAFLGSTEPAYQYHDGDEDVEDEAQEEDSEEDWKEVKVEMVECEVPIRVWPGNTAFKASEVVFEV